VKPRTASHRCPSGGSRLPRQRTEIRGSLDCRLDSESSIVNSHISVAVALIPLIFALASVQSTRDSRFLALVYATMHASAGLSCSPNSPALCRQRRNSKLDVQSPQNWSLLFAHRARPPCVYQHLHRGSHAHATSIAPVYTESSEQGLGGLGVVILDRMPQAPDSNELLTKLASLYRCSCWVLAPLLIGSCLFPRPVGPMAADSRSHEPPTLMVWTPCWHPSAGKSPSETMLSSRT
jgi:hypothetical protein